MSTFGADVGAIMRMDVSMSEMCALLAIRSLYPTDAGPCSAPMSKIAERAKADERTLRRVMPRLESMGHLVRAAYPGRPTTFSVVVDSAAQSPRTYDPTCRKTPMTQDPTTPDIRSDVSQNTLDIGSGDPGHTIRPPRTYDPGSPTPPNKVFYPCSDPSLAEAASAHAPAPAHEAPAITPGLPEVEQAFLAASGGGLQAKHAEMIALQSLTATHGAARVIEACEEAVLANTRPRVSVRFVQAILERPRRCVPNASAHDGHSRTTYVMPLAPEALTPPVESPEARAAALAILQEDL